LEENVWFSSCLKKIQTSEVSTSLECATGNKTVYLLWYTVTCEPFCLRWQ